jgi:hypothetical protein
MDIVTPQRMYDGTACDDRALYQGLARFFPLMLHDVRPEKE